jgi:hypothetical protein
VACRIISCGDAVIRPVAPDATWSRSAGSSTWQVLRFMLSRRARGRLTAPLRSSNSATIRSSAARFSWSSTGNQGAPRTAKRHHVGAVSVDVVKRTAIERAC